jgi:hypothetical protein
VTNLCKFLPRAHFSPPIGFVLSANPSLSLARANEKSRAVLHRSAFGAVAIGDVPISRAHANFRTLRMKL